jgi:hydrogenase maturation factor
MNKAGMNDSENDANVPLESSCEFDQEGHCISCSDQALPATILSVDHETGVAVAIVNNMQEEVDVTLVGNVTPGDVLLVHGGVAISAYESEGQDDMAPGGR